MGDHSDKGPTTEVRALQRQGKRLESLVASHASQRREEGHDEKMRLYVGHDGTAEIRRPQVLVAAMRKR